MPRSRSPIFYTGGAALRRAETLRTDDPATLWLFAAFILLCGTTHWLDVVTLWWPWYGIQATVKAATAIVSVMVAVSLWWYMPRFLAAPHTGPIAGRQ